MNRVLTAFVAVLVGATPFSLAADGLADQTQVMITDTNQSALLGWGTVTNGEMTLEFSGAAPGTEIDFVFILPQGEGDFIPLSGTVQNDGTIKVDSGGREVALSSWLASKNVVLAQRLADKLQPETNDDNKLERVPEAEAPLVTPSTPDIGGESGVESALPQTAPPPQSQTGVNQGANPSPTSPDAALPPAGEGVPPVPGTPVPESAAGTEPGLNDGSTAGGSTEGSAEDAAGQNTSPGTANPEGPGTTDPDTANPGTTGPGTGSGADDGTGTGVAPGAPPAEPGENTQPAPAPQDGSQNGGAAGSGDSGDNSGGDNSSGDNSSGSGENAGETPPAAPDDGSAVDDPGDNGGANDGVSDPGGAQSGADEPSPGEPSSGEPGTEPEAGPADPGSPPGEPDTPDDAPDNSNDGEVSPPDNSAAGDTGLVEPTPEPEPEPTPPTAAPGGDDGSGVSEGAGSAADGADGSQPGDDGAADTGTTGEETPPAPSGP